MSLQIFHFVSEINVHFAAYICRKCLNADEVNVDCLEK